MCHKSGQFNFENGNMQMTHNNATRLYCPMQIILLLSYEKALLTQFKMKNTIKASQLNFNNRHCDLIVKNVFINDQKHSKTQKKMHDFFIQ